MSGSHIRFLTENGKPVLVNKKDITRVEDKVTQRIVFVNGRETMYRTKKPLEYFETHLCQQIED